MSLKSLRKKSDIIIFMDKYFSLVNTELLPLASKRFDFIIDQVNCIDIITRFVGERGRINLNRFLEFKEFVRMQYNIVDEKSLHLTDTINKY